MPTWLEFILWAAGFYGLIHFGLIMESKLKYSQFKLWIIRFAFLTIIVLVFYLMKIPAETSFIIFPLGLVSLLVLRFIKTAKQLTYLEIALAIIISVILTFTRGL